MQIPFKSLCHYDFRVVLIVLNAVLPLGPRVKFNGVILQQYFHMVLFDLYVVLTFESVDEILWCRHSNEFSSVVLSHFAICFVHSSTFGTVGGIQWCYHSTETSLTNLFQSTIYFLEFSNRNLIFCDYFFGLTVRPGKRIYEERCQRCRQ